MAKFDLVKNGYNSEQVDAFIDKLTLRYEEKLSEQKDRIVTLKKENSIISDRLSVFESKDKQISQALIMAVEKAEAIENNARKIYDLEVKRIRLIYQKQMELINLIETEMPQIITKGNIQIQLNELKENLDAILLQNSKLDADSVKNEIKKNSDNYIKNLLNRMDYVINDSGANIKTSRLNNIEKHLKNVNGKLLLEKETADTFLKQDCAIEENAYSKVIAHKKPKSMEPNESGFDIDAVLTPDEELDEIMKIFDFYTEDAN